MPLSPHALERVLAAIVQPDAGAGDEIPDGSRDENFARLREGCNSRPNMDRNAADLVLHEFALPCMKPRADLEAELANAVPNRTRAPNSPCRPVEGREESVAGRIHFPSAEVPNCVRTSRWCSSTSSRHRRSPSSDAREVEPT